MKYSITKDDLLKRVKDSLYYDKKPISASYDMLAFAFGFVRKSGEDIMLTQLLHPSKTEKEICTLPKQQTIENINNWCAEHGFIGYFDQFKDTYFFIGIQPKQLK